MTSHPPASGVLAADAPSGAPLPPTSPDTPLEAVVIGAFIDTTYTARDGKERAAKELVINRLTVLDWAEGRDASVGSPDRAAA